MPSVSLGVYENHKRIGRLRREIFKKNQRVHRCLHLEEWVKMKSKMVVLAAFIVVPSSLGTKLDFTIKHEIHRKLPIITHWAWRCERIKLSGDNRHRCQAVIAAYRPISGHHRSCPQITATRTPLLSNKSPDPCLMKLNPDQVSTLRWRPFKIMKLIVRTVSTKGVALAKTILSIRIEEQ